MVQGNPGLMIPAAFLALAVASCAPPAPPPPTVVYSKTCTKVVPFTPPEGAKIIKGADGQNVAVLPADQPIKLPMMDPADCPP